VSTKTIQWKKSFLLVAIDVEETFPVGTDMYIIENSLRSKAIKEIRERGGGFLTDASPLRNNCPHPREYAESSGPNGCFMHCKLCDEQWND
jgi:hypothetical protein